MTNEHDKDANIEEIQRLSALLEIVVERNKVIIEMLKEMQENLAEV